jgi:hypothetical protein
MMVDGIFEYAYIKLLKQKYIIRPQNAAIRSVKPNQATIDMKHRHTFLTLNPLIKNLLSRSQNVAIRSVKHNQATIDMKHRHAFLTLNQLIDHLSYS